MIRACACLAALLALATTGCEERAAATPVPATAALPTATPLGYVGIWAATAPLCDGGAWRFTPQRLTTAGEVDCEIVDADQGVASWALSVSCHADGGSEPGLLTLTLPDPAKADVMTVQGGPFHGPVTLTRCNG